MEWLNHYNNDDLNLCRVVLTRINVDDGSKNKTSQSETEIKLHLNYCQIKHDEQKSSEDF
jgi:hypothetical protein